METKQHRLTSLEKSELFKLYETGNYTGAKLGDLFKISKGAANGLLRRHGYKAKSQSHLQRIYPINEGFFDDIHTEAQAYILGLLYSDGCNSTESNKVRLALQESDRDILDKITVLIQSTKPLLFTKTTIPNKSNTYQLTINNKHISEQLVELGCVKAKTHIIVFPTEEQLPSRLVRHFIRGYFDGDGYIGKRDFSIVGTVDFCNSLSLILKRELNINTYIITRSPERNNNIRTLISSGGKQVRAFLKWIYGNSSIYLDRKYNKYLEHLNYELSLKK